MKFKRLSQLHRFIYIFLLFAFPAYSQSTYTINDPEDLGKQTYLAGDEIILANGVYDSDERITFVGNGTIDQPIIFRAESPGGVRFTGGLKMNIGGDYVVVEGFHWEGGFGASNFIQFRNGTDYANNSVIRNCVIDGLAIHPDDALEDAQNNSITKHRWVVLYGTNNKVVNCSFMNKKSAGALILSENEYNAEENPCGIIGHSILNNYFFKYEKIDTNLSNSGDSETIRIGTSEFQNVNSNVLVSNNYFVESDGENEIISNKSKGNIFTKNTFRRCRGSLVLRHGSNALVDGNFFLGENVDGTGGIRITDSDHTITNNYIQDCVTVVDQAKWNNGITFLGGDDNPAVECTSTNVSNGYQKSENLVIANNSFINTNAPIYFNIDKGNTDPTGIVRDNLVFFDIGNPNVSDVISGDTEASYSQIGTTLTYQGNVYYGSTLGELNIGFLEGSEIISSIDGEIYNFSGDSVDGKGADLGSLTPIVDDMVGYEIGACFLNSLNENITNGDCDIEIGDQLLVGNVPVFSASASSYEMAVSANVSWIATINDDWISLDFNSGEGSATITVSVAENKESSERVGTITFTQAPGGDDIVRTLSIIQEGADLTDLYGLINIGKGLPGDKVTVHSFSKEEVNGDDKFNYAINTLDKNDDTLWAADDDSILPGDVKGDGEYIIYDLGGIHTINLIQYSTTNKDNPFGFQVWVSNSGTDLSDFSRALPTTGELNLTTPNSTEFNVYEVDGVEVRFVKLIGFGRFDPVDNTRASVWSAVREIEFYGSQTVSTEENITQDSPIIYPNPASDFIVVESIDNSITRWELVDLTGKSIKSIPKMNENKLTLDIRSLQAGVYILLLNTADKSFAQKIIVTR